MRPRFAIWCSNRARTCSARSDSGSRRIASSHRSLMLRLSSTFSRLSLHMDSRPSAAPRLRCASAYVGLSATASSEIAAASELSARARAWSWNTSSVNTWSESDFERQTSRIASFGRIATAWRNAFTAPALSHISFSRRPSFTRYSTRRAWSRRRSSCDENDRRMPPTTFPPHRFACLRPSLSFAGEMGPRRSSIDRRCPCPCPFPIRSETARLLPPSRLTFSSPRALPRSSACPNGSIQRSKRFASAAAHLGMENVSAATPNAAKYVTLMKSVATNWSISSGRTNCLILCPTLPIRRRAPIRRFLAPASGPSFPLARSRSATCFIFLASLSASRLGPRAARAQKSSGSLVGEGDSGAGSSSVVSEKSP